MSILKKINDKLKVWKNEVKYGNIIILIGKRGCGKSETIKTLCKNISGHKYVIYFDDKLKPKNVHPDDVKGYKKAGCKIINNEKYNDWEPGVYILEDFPQLINKAKRDLYNIIKDIRHLKMNLIIVAHDYKVVKKSVFPHSNNILLYQNPVITPHQLGPKLNRLSEGFSIQRALNDLQQYHYILVSFDHKKWYNQSINSRNSDILENAVRGLIDPNELVEIYYPKKNANKSNKVKKYTKTELVEPLLQIGFTTEEICTTLGTTPGFIWKEKSKIKKRYQTIYGKKILKGYLRDNRKKK